ncbi:MAG TPA: hypothetical protein VMW73_06245 [Spirochaetia bacterium]|nr:hypothetical protein [Spirochaetia bacterium]
MRTKIAIFAMAMLLTSAIVFAGGSAEKSSTATAGPEKVYWYAWTAPANMVDLIAAFNKKYAGKYELVYQKMADAATLTINTALASGAPISVMTQASAFDLRERADSGVFLGLKQFFDKAGLDYATVFGKSVEETMNFNGDYYAVPYANNINMVFFNEKMFDAAGVPYPQPHWTWSDFRAAAKKLTHGTGANKVYGAMLDVAAPNGDEYWATIAQQKLGSFWYYNSDFKTTRFDAPAMKESLQFFYDMFMVDRSAVPLSQYTALKYNNDTNGMKGLYSGRYAMWVAPVYGSLYLMKSYGEVPEGTRIGLANLPRPDGLSQSVSTTYSSQASIPKNTPDKEGAWAAIKMATIDNAELYAGQKAMNPGYQFSTNAAADAFYKLIFNDKPGLDVSEALKVMLLPRELISKDNTHIQGQAKINELINSDMTLVFNGEMSVDAALKDLKTKGDQYIAADMNK